MEVYNIGWMNFWGLNFENLCEIVWIIWIVDYVYDICEFLYLIVN